MAITPEPKERPTDETREPTETPFSMPLFEEVEKGFLARPSRRGHEATDRNASD